ncbi:hypothetical protein H4S07_002966 [Coemansia furcata]|uniref:Uncharacterized protein n=1 Tax=Coemansia furcata TaxID=417177 RepID=A0ACC1LJ15_9FUNG|nr:hypothetical protein H4S07_002966 [Coemansia furcata]
MRPAWLKKDTTADAAAAAAAAAVEAAHAPPSSLLASPDSPRIKELTSATPGKPKALSRTRVRELLTIAMIRTYIVTFDLLRTLNLLLEGGGDCQMVTTSGSPLPPPFPALFSAPGTCRFSQ